MKKATWKKTSKKATPSKPVAIKPPVIHKKKKDASEASYSNNRPQASYTHTKHYEPTPSRGGKGTASYGGKIKVNGFRDAASFGTSFIPYVGDAKDIQEFITGRDLIAGKKLSAGDRVVTGVAAALPVVSGPMLKSAGKGVKIAGEKVPKVLKKIAKRTEPVVKKAVKKKGVATDTAKKLKSKAVKKLKGVTGKKTVGNISKSGSKPIIKISEKNVDHIFRKAKGHFAEDTVHNRKLLESTVNEKKNCLGIDKYGNEWYSKVNKDGTQIWAQVRNGEIRNGGFNNPPINYNSETGLSSPIKPKQGVKK